VSRDAVAERSDSNHFALDSLVFGRIHLREVAQTVHLWKKFLTWAKATQWPRLAMSDAFVENKFRRARETGFDFSICEKTLIS
jgi:hypothetical protein